MGCPPRHPDYSRRDLIPRAQAVCPSPLWLLASPSAAPREIRFEFPSAPSPLSLHRHDQDQDDGLASRGRSLPLAVARRPGSTRNRLIGGGGPVTGTGANTALSAATLSAPDAHGAQTLTLPIQFQTTGAFVGQVANWSGRIMATTIVPEPSPLALGGLALWAILARNRLRRGSHSSEIVWALCPPWRPTEEYSSTTFQATEGSRGPGGAGSENPWTLTFQSHPVPMWNFQRSVYVNNIQFTHVIRPWIRS